MIRLGVNIDHVATLRQARGTRFPDPVQAAVEAEQAGADAITTLHLREDRRHIQERDVELLSSILATRMNLEMAVTEEMVANALRLRPAECCLVPERRQELTTEGGLDVAGTHEKKISAACARLGTASVCHCSWTPSQSKSMPPGADRAPVIEIHTGRYADARGADERAKNWRASSLACNRAWIWGCR